MKRRWLVVGGVVMALVLVTAVGWVIQSGSTMSPSTFGVRSSASDQMASTGALPPSAAEVAPAAKAGVAAGGSAATNSGSPAASVAQPMIVTTATLGLRVNDVVKSVAALRKIATASGAQIAELTYVNGSPEEPRPLPASSAGDASSAADNGQPSSAQVTLRVPADKLAAVTQAASALGTVTGQSESQSDVTVQHVDLAARLRNLQAEEARLRQLFAKAGSVSGLLEVERELSSVRGEIESTKAQLAYLESQVALSTLQVSLTQPGAIVRPASGVTWGFADAVTAGVQSAIGLTRAFITGAIALVPVALLVLIGWGALRLARRARTARQSGASSETPAQP